MNYYRNYVLAGLLIVLLGFFGNVTAFAEEGIKNNENVYEINFTKKVTLNANNEYYSKGIELQDTSQTRHLFGSVGVSIDDRNKWSIDFRGKDTSKDWKQIARRYTLGPDGSKYGWFDFPQSYTTKEGIQFTVSRVSSGTDFLKVKITITGTIKKPKGWIDQ